MRLTASGEAQAAIRIPPIAKEPKTMSKIESNPAPDAASDNNDFEQSLSQLESLVDRLESGQLGLDESLKLYEQGMGLAQHCQGMLEQAQQKVDVLKSQHQPPEAFNADDEFV